MGVQGDSLPKVMTRSFLLRLLRFDTYLSLPENQVIFQPSVDDLEFSFFFSPPGLDHKAGAPGRVWDIHVKYSPILRCAQTSPQTYPDVGLTGAGAIIFRPSGGQ